MDYGEFEVAVNKQIQRTNTAIESNGPERLGYVDFWRAMPASSTETVGDRSELTRRGANFCRRGDSRVQHEHDRTEPANREP
jgi:hypothetical protein